MKAVLFACAIALAFVAVSAGKSDGWTMYGIDTDNSRFVEDTSLTRKNIGSAVKLWEVTTDGFPSITGVISDDGVVYWPDALGFVYAINEETGALIWKKDLRVLFNRATAQVKGTPYLNGDELVMATHDQGAPVMFALHRKSGLLRWVSEILDTTPVAWVTASPSYNPKTGFYYVGMSSRETTTAADPTYACCMFAGKFIAVDPATGLVVFRTILTPSQYPYNGTQPQYPGVAVWGSGYPFDNDLGHVYIGTGQNYKVPPALDNCRAAAIAACGGAKTGSCAAAGLLACRDQYDSPNNHMESVLALDTKTGAIKWSYRAGDDGGWTAACSLTNNPNCPVVPGGDFDFPQAPMLMKVNGKKALVIGQKSGVMHVLDRKTGSLIYANQLVPGGYYGGFQWGLSNDGKIVYGTSTNFGQVNYTTASGKISNAGSVLAYDPKTNKKVWEFTDPKANTVPTGLASMPSWAMFPGPVVATPELVFATSTTGDFYVLDSRDGSVLLTGNPQAGSLGSGAMVNGNKFFMANGFRSGSYSIDKTKPFKIYAYAVPKKN